MERVVQYPAQWASSWIRMNGEPGMRCRACQIESLGSDRKRTWVSVGLGVVATEMPN